MGAQASFGLALGGVRLCEGGLSIFPSGQGLPPTGVHRHHLRVRVRSRICFCLPAYTVESGKWVDGGARKIRKTDSDPDDFRVEGALTSATAFGPSGDVVFTTVGHASRALSPCGVLLQGGGASAAGLCRQ